MQQIESTQKLERPYDSLVLMQQTDSTRKLEWPYDGLYKITEVFTNGTVAIQKGIVNEHVNIHCILLYHQMPN